MLSSRVLHGSESLRAFLKFVVLNSLDNGNSGLKEYTIATEVFGRGPTYDSRSDSVVRVQAGRLRSKLQEYYRSEGIGDRILIDLPKGHYAPVLAYAQPRIQTQIPEQVAAIAKPALEEADGEATASGKGDFSRIFSFSPFKTASAILGVAVLSLTLVSLNYRSDNERLKKQLATLGTDRLADAPSVWQPLLKSSDPLMVAFSNVLFEGTAETGMRLLEPLDTPVKGAGGPGLERVDPDSNASALTEHYTGIGEAMGLYMLSSFLSRTNRPFRVKRSLLVTWDDLTAGNIVFLGSPAENYLLRDLPQHQDFVFGIVKDGVDKPTFGIINTKPAPGEQKFYVASQEGPSRSQISEDYALISMLRGLDERHRIFVLAGITTFGTQAAAQYVSEPQYADDLLSHLTASAPGGQQPAYYQALVKVKVNGGVPVQLTYVTHHAL